jgi:hypothetical protein
MEWSDKVQDMMQTWTKTQQKLWSGWLETMQSVGQAPGNQVLDKAIDTWQESVNNTLDAQSKWMQTWAESLKSVKGAPEPLADWGRRSQESMQSWNEAQRQLWENWFQLLKKSAPGTIPTSPEDAEKLLKEWQVSARKAMESQIEVMSSWFKSEVEKASKEVETASKEVEKTSKAEK